LEVLFNIDWPEKRSDDHAFLLGAIFAQGTEERVNDPLSFFTRFLCHLFVSNIPRQGLPELCESLQDIYLYYQTPFTKEPSLLTQSERLPGKLGRTYERPEFQIAEE